MSFRQYGGINYAARNNIVKNNYTNANNLSVMTKVGQPDSIINVDSGLYSLGNTTIKGQLTIDGVNADPYAGIIYISDNYSVPNATLRLVSYSNGKNYIQSAVNGQVGNSADLYFTDMKASHVWMSIKANGYVGIGTTNPLYNLDVSGTLNVTGNITTTNYPIWGNYVTANLGNLTNSPVVNLNISSNQASVGYYTGTINDSWSNFTPQGGRNGGIYWIVANVSDNCTLAAGPYNGCSINLTSGLSLTAGNLVLIRIYVSNFNNSKGYLVDVSRYI